MSWKITFYMNSHTRMQIPPTTLRIYINIQGLQINICQEPDESFKNTYNKNDMWCIYKTEL